MDNRFRKSLRLLSSQPFFTLQISCFAIFATEIESEKERTTMEEERNWEELDRDLLVQILARVGTESLICDIPFVCKSWYQASLVPNCWEILLIPRLQFSDEIFMSLVDRSQGTATHIVVLSRCTKQRLLYLSEKCPTLKTLNMWDFDEWSLTGDLVSKWKKLEYLHMSGFVDLKQILESISIHCKNFTGLSCTYSLIGEGGSEAIVKFLPKIKYLKMSRSALWKEYLKNILKGCRELEFLDVSNCSGFSAHDTQILELASHIPSFNCEGSYDDENLPMFPF